MQKQEKLPLPYFFKSNQNKGWEGLSVQQAKHEITTFMLLIYNFEFIHERMSDVNSLEYTCMFKNLIIYHKFTI